MEAPVEKVPLMQISKDHYSTTNFKWLHRDVLDAVNGCSLLLCTAAMSGSYLGLRVEPSHNAIFREWQEVSSSGQPVLERNVKNGT
jgi:predicted RNA methylase